MRVIFRKTTADLKRHQSTWSKPIAILPDIPYLRGDCRVVSHTGSYWSSDYRSAIEDTRPVSVDDPDVQKLLSLLERMGYHDLEVKKRMPRK